MYRTALRSSPSALRAIRPTLASGSRRLASTAPASKSKKGTWKGTGLRWGLAAAAVYFYNTSPIFADELPAQAGPAPPHFSDSDLPTIDAMIEEKRRQAAAAAPPPAPAPRETTKLEEAKEEVKAKVEDVKEKAQDVKEKVKAKAEEAKEKVEGAIEDVKPTEAAEAPEPGSPEALEQEAMQQGAFNPETGEINWDCPCLGGMADGPCGEQFKAAFSCFVYSESEPKGMDCIDKFQHMQDCFRLHPEIYGSELTDDDDEAPAEGEAALAKSTESQPPSEPKKEEENIPKEAHDATDANKA